MLPPICSEKYIWQVANTYILHLFKAYFAAITAHVTADGWGDRPDQSQNFLDPSTHENI